MRLTLRVAAIAATLLLCLPIHYLWRLLGLRSPWPRRFLGSVARIAGMRARIVGTPLRSDVLFVANHLSWLDILLLAGASGTSFVSKDEVARWPLIGWLSRLNRTVFVVRGERKAVRNQADTLRSALLTGQPVALFPEGTTEGGEEVLPFRPSLFSAVVPPATGVRVQPVAIDYGSAAREIAWVGEEPAAANAKRILRRKGTIPVTIRFLDPIDPAAFQDRKMLAQVARAAIVAALDAFAEPADPL